MSRKPTLSPSKLSTYLACPVKYRWTYVDARGKWYVRAKSCYSFGSTLHRTLEQFHSGGRAGVPTTDEVLAAYEENWIDAGYSSPEEMAEAHGDGKAMLLQFVERERTREEGRRTAFVERLFRLDLDDFDLIGRPDRIDEHEDGTYEIVDYKTGREQVCSDDVANSLAMSVYQLLVRRTFPDRAVRATICALRTGASASHALTDEELDALEASLRELGARILSDDFFEFEPRLKHICDRCDFIPLCKRHGAFAEELVTSSQALD